MSSRRTIIDIAVSLSNVAALWETILGLRQVLGLSPARNSMFVLTGTFSNPGPYGGCIAILLAMLGSYVLIDKGISRLDRILRWTSVVSCCLCIVVLPATLSRSAWLALGAAGLALGFRKFGLAGRIRSHKMTSLAVAAAVLLCAVGAFFLKKDSAVGRLHIWNIELRAMADKPWTGYGKGRFLGAYGDAQAEYFSSGNRPDAIVRVAGSPEYAFNEYFKVGVERGIPVMLAMFAVTVALVALLLKFFPPIGYGAVVLAVFAFCSYPFSCIEVKSSSEREWERVRVMNSMERYDDAAEELSKLYPELRGNYRFLYDYGYALYRSGRFVESIPILEEGTALSSDPMFYNIIGRNYEALGRYGEAEMCLRHAHHMVPSRLYPLVLLMDMKAAHGDYEDAAAYAREIVEMPVNERNGNMVELHDHAERMLDSLVNN